MSLARTVPRQGSQTADRGWGGGQPSARYLPWVAFRLIYAHFPRLEAATKGRELVEAGCGGVATGSPSAENLPSERASRIFPGGAGSIRDAERRESRLSFGPARTRVRALGECGQRPRGRPISTGAVHRPPALLPGKGEGAEKKGGGGRAGRRREEEVRLAGRAGWRPLSRTYQSPHRSNVPAARREGAVPAHKGAGAPSLRLRLRCTTCAFWPLSLGNSAQPVLLLQGAASGASSVK